MDTLYLMTANYLLSTKDEDDERLAYSFIYLYFMQTAMKRMSTMMLMAGSIIIMESEGYYKPSNKPYLRLHAGSIVSAAQARERISDYHWEKLFRFTKAQYFEVLLPVLFDHGLPLQFKVKTRPQDTHYHVCEGPLAVLMLLAELSAPRSLCPDMENWFQQDATRICRFWRAALGWICIAFRYTLSFDKHRLRHMLPHYAMKVGEALGVARPQLFRCWGFVDGTFRFCCRPELFQEQLYNGYYGGHGWKYQMVVSPCGIVEDVSGPYFGRENDAELVRMSRLEERMATFCFRPEFSNPYFHIYGDPAYALSEYIHNPFRRANSTPEEEHFNTLMSSVRVSVEHAIGHVSNLFPALDFLREEKLGLTPVGLKFLGACILRNVLTVVRGSNQISIYFNCDPPTLEEFTRSRKR